MVRGKGEKQLSKKGQTTQIFFFILAIIVIGLLLLFGVKYIMELGAKVDQIDLVRFKTDMEGYAQEITPVYGRWKKLDISVPAGIDKICFVQYSTGSETPLYHTQEGLCDNTHEDYSFLMCQAWQDDVSRNLYTEPFDRLDVGIDLGTIEVGSVDQYYLCVDTSDGLLRIKMTGYGDHLLVEEWA
jgi:hypothetical protein